MKRNLWKTLLLGCLFPVLVGCGQSSAPAGATEDATPQFIVVAPSGKLKAAREGNKKPGAQEQPAPPGKGFAFPDDPGGRELARKLPPKPKSTLPAFPATTKITWQVSPSATRLVLPLMPTQVPLPRLPQEKNAAALLPGAVPEDLPLSDDTSLSLPAEPRLETGAPVHVTEEGPSPSDPLVKVSEPAASPSGATDPTRDASWKAALSAALPQRGIPVPFVPRNLPDPFANRKTGELHNPPPEDLTPVVANPAVP